MLSPALFIFLSILLFENLDVNLQVNQQNKRSEQVKPTIIEVFLLFWKYIALFLIIDILNYSKTLPLKNLSTKVTMKKKRKLKQCSIYILLNVP